MIEVGTKVIANWGAMHPVEYGTVSFVHDDGTANVMFDTGVFRMGLCIREECVDRTPIGVFVNKETV